MVKLDLASRAIDIILNNNSFDPHVSHHFLISVIGKLEGRQMEFLETELGKDACCPRIHRIEMNPAVSRKD